MSDSTSPATLPPAIARVLARFQAMGREEKMQALVHYSKKLEPVPERFRALELSDYAVPECQTRVHLFPDARDGKLHFYAELNARQSPTIAAFLAILFSSINDQPPSVTLALPADYVQRLMDGIGLAGREVGLSAMVARIRAFARSAPNVASIARDSADPPTAA
jgi:cysteine desulfuration protein SufE